jgi:methionine-rich copper-binding protein CopC
MALVVALMAMSGALLSPASAHAALESSDPANGASLAQAPTTVTLTFGEPVNSPVLTSSDDVGTPVTLGDVSVSGSTVTASWPSGTGGGLFRVEWQVTSADGDVVDGVILFSIAGPKATGNTAVPAPGGTGGSGVPGWVWALLVVVLIGVGLVLVLARRSRSAAARSSDSASSGESDERSDGGTDNGSDGGEPDAVTHDEPVDDAKA